ncbi:MAG: AraC family transcriptional regulator [Bacteroidota bacterium]
MKPIIQKLPLHENSSFVARTYKTPNFEVGWHQHIEHELILFTEGSGLSFVGNHVGEFETGDIYLLGSNLPHSFKKRDPKLVTSAIVVQFTEDFWGTAFLNLPECRHIRELLATSIFGLKISTDSKKRLWPIIRELETAVDFRRILLLGECLEIISRDRGYIEVSTQDVRQLNSKDKDTIDLIFRFTIENFKEPITLTRVADLACMSTPSFCNYFKKSTKKTYTDFLNEVRTGYACTLLLDTKKSVLEICFESGYNTMANFHKQFIKIRKFTPLQYRKYFAGRLSSHTLG